MDKITAKHIKGALLHYFRFKRGWVPATEVTYGLSIADVMVYNAVEIIEIEVKISKGDLLKEAVDENKKFKHGFSFSTGHYKKPNKFFFCVPTELVDITIEIAKEINNNYGVLEYIHKEQRRLKDRIRVRKNAKILHTEYHKDICNYINKRLTSEICNMYEKFYIGENNEK